MARCCPPHFAMRIFYVNVIEQNAGWGAEWFVDRELVALGHETQTLDYRQNRSHLSRRFLETEPFDAFLLQRGEGFPMRLVEAVQRPRIYWASELVARRRDQDTALSSGLFEHVFVRTPACKRAVVERGWLRPEQISILLSAFDPHTHRRLPDIERDIDVLFVGARLPRRTRILDRLSRNFHVEVRRAFGNEMVRLFNRARIVLNIHAEHALDTETRVYEALGCGALLITERLSEENPFEPGKHLVEAAHESELEAAIEHYLSSPDERERIADAGHREAMDRHTYHSRAQQIASCFEALLAEWPSRGTHLDAASVRRFQRVEFWVATAWQLRRYWKRLLGRARVGL